MKPAALPKVSLEQWLALVAVVEEGTVARAAERLHKSQSTVSYALARLEELLAGPPLWQPGRYGGLSPAGETLYRHAKGLIDKAQAAEDIAHALARGVEPQLILVVDAVAPLQPALCALEQLARECPTTRIKLIESSLSGTDEAVLSQACDVAVMVRVPPGFNYRALPPSHLIACAAPSHRLARLSQIDEATLARERQVVLADSGLKREQDSGWLKAEQRWTVTHFGTALDVVRAGLGFGFLPEYRVEAALKAGELVALPLEFMARREIPLQLVLTKAEPGPGARALADALYEAMWRQAGRRGHSGFK